MISEPTLFTRTPGATHLLAEFDFEPNRNKSNSNGLGSQEYYCVSKVFSPVTSTIRKSVMMTNSNLAKFSCIQDSILIASGDVEVDGFSSSMLIICSGKITLKRSTWRDLAFAGSKIYIYESEKLKKAELYKESKLLPNDKKLLGVKFHTCVEDGLEATFEKVGATVKAITAKKPFDVAEVKVGDVIEKINGEPVPSLHELNRLLCRATVASGTARLKLRRNGDVVVVEVKLKEW